MNNAFRIDILDANGNKLGDGPLKNVESVKITSSLDKTGSASFVVPATEPRTQHITAGSQFDIYDEVDGYLGRFIYSSKDIANDSTGSMPKLAIQLYDALRELSRRTVTFRRNYVYQWVDAVVDDLIGVMGDWTADADASIGHTTVGYEGESVLVAIDELRDRWGKHYRLKSNDPANKVLEFGAFGEASGLRITNLFGQVQHEIDARTEIALVKSIKLTSQSEEIFNRIIPLGAGQGVSQLTIANATSGSYATQTGTNTDGSSYYYIEDTASIAAYGLREKVLTFPSIRPISNSDANIINAANALKNAAEVYMGRHLEPRVEYSLTITGLRQSLKVGDTVRLVYRGVVDGDSYMSIDDDFYVMDLTRSRSASGERSTALAIASIAARRTADSDILIGAIHDLNALKVHVPLSMCYLKANESGRIDGSNDVEFSIRINTEVLALNRALLRVKTSPLKSSVTAVGAAGGSVGTSGSGGGTTQSSTSGGGTTATSDGGGDHHHNVYGAYSGSPPGTFSDQYFTGVIVDSGGTGHSEVIKVQADNAYSGGRLRTFDASGDHSHDVTVPNHSHNVTIPNHTHSLDIPGHNHSMSYGLYADTNYPQGISLSIDSVDVTAALGGPWAPSNAGIDIELDITDYLVNASGGLRQNHTLKFEATGGQGEVVMECDMLVTVQPIAVV